MKKNVYKAHEITLTNGLKFTRYDVDVDTLTEFDDWKNYKRMELNPGDTIHLSDGVILKVVKDNSDDDYCGACALLDPCPDIHTKPGGSKEAALCMMCDCGDIRDSAPYVHLEEV